jgi:hypothetical protein
MLVMGMLVQELPAPSYKKSIWTFDEGDSQQWMEVMIELKEIWLQNSVDDLMYMSNAVVAVLKGDSLTEAAVEDLTVDPADEAQRIPLTEDHIKKALCVVTETVFPFRSLETQKQWMSKCMQKPYDMTGKSMMNAMSRINNFLPYFPHAMMDSEYTEKELIGILVFAVLPYYTGRHSISMTTFPLTKTSKSLFFECERVKRNKPPKSFEQDAKQDEQKNCKK